MTEESPETQDAQPRLNADAFACPRCGAFAHQQWHAVDASEWIDNSDQQGQVTRYRLWREAICSRCDKPSLWCGDQLIYPQARLGPQPHQDMPSDVRELYEEARTVAGVSRRAGAALARATVERLIKTIDPDATKSANLDKRIERIRPQLTPQTAQLLDVLRVTGNDALHVDDVPGELVVMALDDEEGPALLELLLETANNLVEEMIARPATVGGLWNKLPEGIRNRIIGAGANPQADAT